MASSLVLRVLLVDDHVMVRDGLKRLIDEQPDMTVVAEAGDGRDALRLVELHAPDVVLLDISMPGWDGATLAQELTRRHPHVRFIAVTRHNDEVFVRKMLAAGVAGYVLKQSASSELVRAVRAVASGESYIDASVKGRGVVQPLIDTTLSVSMPGSALLTRDEEWVLRHVAASWTHQRIAEQLAVSLSEVFALRASAMQKAGLTTRMQVINYARTHGWIEQMETPPDS